MEDKQEKSPGLSINTTLGFREDVPVSEHLSKVREQLRERLEDNFQSLPDIRLNPSSPTSPSSLDRYIWQNPQAVIFVPEKDLNMFPVVLDEVRDFVSDKLPKEKAEKRLKDIYEHEFEHVEKIYELGVDLEGMGFIMMKIRGKPVLGGFVTAPQARELELRNQLRVLLAPKTLKFRNADDIRDSQKLVWDRVRRAKSVDEAFKAVGDLYFVLSESYLPKKVHSIVKGIIDSGEE